MVYFSKLKQKNLWRQTMTLSILAHNVRRLRVSKKLSQKKLAEMTGLSSLAIINLENEKDNPRMSTVESIAKALNVKLLELFSPVRELKTVRFRSNKKMQNRENILAKTFLWLDNYNFLEETLDEFIPFRLENVFKQNQYNNIIDASSLCRNELGLDQKIPINDICMLITEAGIKLHTISLASDDFFGLSIGKEDGGPAIIVNAWDRISVERRIFSAAHELGHLISHKKSYNIEEIIENNDEEKEASFFAAHFLMPDEGFMKAWADASGLHWVDRILKVKHIFHVSYKTVIFRLLEHGLVDSLIWKDFLLQYQRRYKRKLPFKEEPYTGNSAEPDGLSGFDFYEERFSRLVRQAVEKEKISLSRGAEMLSISIEDMQERLKGCEVI